MWLPGFSDPSLAHECVDYCSVEEVSCLAECESDTSCVFDCIIETATCTYNCPCYDGCPLGCQGTVNLLKCFQIVRQIRPKKVINWNWPFQGCTSDFCTCRDLTTDPDFIACERQFQIEYLTCIDDCSHDDVRCLAACSREYDDSLKDCPCQENCPTGCPCPDYVCDEPATTTNPVPNTTTTPAFTQS